MNAKTVELHLLQSFPPSCVNRDGNNSPKDCTFGDVRRARISSQCLKRAIRQAESFSETVGEAIATRSKNLRQEKLIPYLKKKGLKDDDAATKAAEFSAKLAKADAKNKEKSSVALFFGDAELYALLDAYLAGDDKWIEKGARKSPDVALFGRMLAEATELGVDAASQVAHAISTHKLSQEMDYWTAADDLKDRSKSDDAGADMLGTAEFNASVFYRYACVNIDQLGRNLGEKNEKGEWSGGAELSLKTLHGFLLAAFEAIPTGKLNGHGHYNPPFLALAVVRRKGMPLNLCNAFLEPVRAQKDKDIGIASADALLTHLTRMRKMVPVDNAQYVLAHALAKGPSADGVESVEGYAALVKKVLEGLK